MAIQKRGSPGPYQVIHLYVRQFRPGMVEGLDYSLKVACNNGNFHIWYSDKTDQVTCPECLRANERQTHLCLTKKRS